MEKSAIRLKWQIKCISTRQKFIEIQNKIYIFSHVRTKFAATLVSTRREIITEKETVFWKIHVIKTSESKILVNVFRKNPAI